MKSFWFSPTELYAFCLCLPPPCPSIAPPLIVFFAVGRWHFAAIGFVISTVLLSVTKLILHVFLTHANQLVICGYVVPESDAEISDLNRSLNTNQILGLFEVHQCVLVSLLNLVSSIMIISTAHRYSCNAKRFCRHTLMLRQALTCFALAIP